jgi:hypothetical protein
MTTKFISQLKAGDLIRAHGGVFKVTVDAKPSIAHHTIDRTRGQYKQLPEAPDCAYAKAVCIEGEFPGYFKPGSDWTFQGNFKAGQLTLAD